MTAIEQRKKLAKLYAEYAKSELAYFEYKTTSNDKWVETPTSPCINSDLSKWRVKSKPKTLYFKNCPVIVTTKVGFETLRFYSHENHCYKNECAFFTSGETEPYHDIKLPTLEQIDEYELYNIWLGYDKSIGNPHNRFDIILKIMSNTGEVVTDSEINWNNVKKWMVLKNA